MLLQYLDLAFSNPIAFFMLLAAFAFSMLIGLSFHEFSHALAARALGDRTAERAGRLTLNPRAHLDPIGSVMILLAGFGWAKPTPVNVNNTRHPMQSLALVALAGPASNLVIAALASIPLSLGLVSMAPFSEAVELFFVMVIQLNVLLAVFNFLPLAPLDGFKVVQGLLPRNLGQTFSQLEAWGPGLLFLLIALPWLTNGSINPLSVVMSPLVGFFLNLFLDRGLV